MNNSNFIMERANIEAIKSISVQMEVSNRIAILDRLLKADVITKESYIEELKVLLSK